MTPQSDRPRRRYLLGPFALLILALAAHGAYWVFVSGQIRTGAQDWIRAQEEAGYVIDHQGLSVDGYPFRFSLRVSAPVIAAPRAEGGWRADVDRLAATAQFYNLNHWIVTPDGIAGFDIQTDDGPARWLIGSQAARLSLSGRGGATTRVGASVDQLTLQAETGPAPGIEAIGALALSGFLDEDDRLSLRLQADALRFSADVLDSDVERAFGREAQLLRMDAVVTAFAALARAGDPAAWRRAGGALEIERAQMVWGAADLAGSGTLALDDDLLPAGRLSVVVTDPETLIGSLVEAGLVRDDQGDALSLAALMAPRREGGIALPLRLQQGSVFLGPARLGRFAEPGGDSPDE